MTTISRIYAREILDSRGKPTCEVEVSCRDGRTGRAQVPSGASTGQFEAHERRDTDSSRYAGQGVRAACDAVNTEIHAVLAGLDAADQTGLDRRLCELDGTPNKSRLGANAVLGVSLAAAVAAANSLGTTLAEHLHALWTDALAREPRPARPARPPLDLSRMSIPVPMVNMISGGRHAGANLDFQDYLIIPVGATRYSEALEWIVRIYWKLGTILSERGYEGRLVGDEGGYGPRLPDNRLALELICRSIEQCGLEPGLDVALALDVASTQFFRGDSYRLAATGTAALSRQQLVDTLAEWSREFPIVSIEDGQAEDDWDGWKILTQSLGDRVQLVGDDLFVTNRNRLAMGIERGVANSVLIKVNQIGSLTETFQTLALAAANGYRPVVSARSGETEDGFLADLAVATGAGQIKIGSIARSERLAKYNQLLRLEEQLAPRATWHGWQPVKNA
jgi:enolase